jgi:hypothetical protein
MTPLILLGAVVLISMGVCAALRYKTRVDQKEFLLRPLSIDTKTRPTLGLVEATPPTLSTFDVLYNMSKIDPDCLRGVEHLHHAKGFSSLGDLMNYLNGSILPEHLNGAVWKQVIDKYKGFTGEEVAFDHFRAAGHQVDIPISATEPGHDVAVDGQLYNIKITDNPSTITEHFEQHPDIDVITNSEMRAAFADDPHVHIDSALSAQDTFYSTADTFVGVHDIGTLIDHIPLITLVLSAGRNARGVLAKRKNVKDAVAHTAIDTASKGLGGMAGAKVGFLIGVALAPATGGLSAIIATAGCTLAGSIGGVVTGRSVGAWFKGRHLRELKHLLEGQAINLRDVFERRVNDIIGTFKKSYGQQIRNYRTARSRLQNWLLRIVAPSTLTTFYSLACARAKTGYAEWRQVYRLIHKDSLRKTAIEGGLYIYSYGRDLYICSEQVLAAWDGVHDSLLAVEKERLRIS